MLTDSGREGDRTSKLTVRMAARHCRYLIGGTNATAYEYRPPADRCDDEAC